MLAKLVIFCLAFMFLLGIAFAGTLVELSCDTCGFKSGSMQEGCGFAGVRHTIIFCDICKTFYSIPTDIEFETEKNAGADLVKPTGKEDFLGSERLVYPCPRCGSKGFSYDGPACPMCNKGTLKKEDLGYWD